MASVLAQSDYATPYTFTELAGSYPGTTPFDEPWGVAVDAAGNVYVADRSDDTIRVIASGGAVSILAGTPGASGSADGTGAAARFNVPEGIAVDGSGNVYVGDSGNETIRKITSAGVVTTIAGTAGVLGSADGTGAAASFNQPCGIAADGSGNLYVADAANQTIRKITPGGAVTTLAGMAGATGSADGTGSAARFNDPFFVAVDNVGNVYVADNANCTIRKISGGGVVTTLAGAAGVTGSADGAGSAARFNYPFGVAVDSAGNVYVSEQLSETLRKVTPGGAVTTLAGTVGAGSPILGPGAGSSAAFFDMTGVAVDSAGNVYAPSSLGVVFWGALAVPAQTSGTTVLGSTVQAFAYTATFSGALAGPYGATGLPVGLSIDPATGVISGTITAGVGYYPVTLSAANGAGTGTGNLTIGVNVPGPPTGLSIVLVDGGAVVSFSAPANENGNTIAGYYVLAQPSSGVGLLVYEASSPIVISGLASNVTYTFSAYEAGSLGNGFSVTGPSMTTEPLDRSVGLGAAATLSAAATGTPLPTYQWQHNGANISGATGSTLTISNAQLTDAGSYTMVATNPSGSTTSIPATVSVTVPITYAASHFATLPGSANGPEGLAVDSSGNVYASQGDAIERVTSAGAVSLVAGSLTAPGSADGTGAAASFNGPTGIATDIAGNIYVADSGNNSIRKVTSHGAVTTLAGLVQGDADGVGVAAQFNDPTAVAVDGSDNVYVVDSGNNALRKVAPDGTTTTLLAPPYAFANGPNGASNYSLVGVALDSSGTPCASFAVTVPGNAHAFVTHFVYVFKVTGVGAYTLLFQDEDPLDASDSGPGFRNGQIASDASGNIYVLCGNEPFEETYNLSLNGNGFGQIPENFPVAIASDANGDLYEADPVGNAIVLVSPVGVFPSISTQPVGATIAFGVKTTLSVVASSSPAPRYQWQVDGVNIAGATSSSYTTSTPGTYTVLVTNSAGTVRSSPAVIAAENRLVNISSRALVGTQGNLEIAGFVIAGPPGSTEQVLVRAVGPTLAQFGVSGVLNLPQLSLFDSSGNGLASNTGWNTAPNAAQIAAAITSTGAFALPLDSGDSAILISLPPGAYTAEVSGLNTTTGVALAEVYEVNAGDPELINISTRAYVGTGSGVEIGGFIVKGSQPAKVLVRAVGPTLGQFGVNGVLAKPSLSVMDSSGNTVATNTGWSTNPDPAAISAEMAAVGAFALPSGSADCALVLTLAPGAYTAVVTGAGGTSGVALVEVYQAP